MEKTSADYEKIENWLRRQLAKGTIGEDGLLLFLRHAYLQGQLDATVAVQEQLRAIDSELRVSH